MIPDPPPALAVGTYTPGTKIGLGKTASWDYPYCILRKSWTCVQYNSQDPITGALTQALSIPVDGDDGDYFWPAWSEKMDYGQKESEPWCGWTVSYNGLYYQPSIWLSSAQRGVNPAQAVCTVGQEAGWRYQYGVNASPKQVLKNQSHSIRAWECKGSYLEYNQWEDPYYFFYAFNPETGEHRHWFTVLSFLESVDKPELIGGTGFGSYNETYYPTSYQLREVKAKSESNQWDPGRTVPWPDTGSPEGTEPIGFNPISGAMPTKGIVEKNPYTLTGTTAIMGMDADAFIVEGCSVRLWYQKGISRQYEEFTSLTEGYAFRQRFEVSSSPMPADKVYIVDTLLGWWNQQNLTWYAWGQPVGNATITNQPNYYSVSGKSAIFVTVQHPVALTRKVKLWSSTERSWASYRARATGPDSYVWELADAGHSAQYASQTLSFTQKHEPLNIGGLDSNNKWFYENSAHQIATYTYKSTYIDYPDRPGYVSTEQDYTGIQQWLDD